MPTTKTSSKTSKSSFSQFGSNFKRNVSTSDILSGIGSAIQAKGDLDLQAMLFKNQGASSMAAGETNAMIAEGNIASTKRRYEIAAARKLDAFNALSSKQLALFSKGGIDVGTGTAARVIDKTRLIGEFEAAAIRFAGFEAVENLRVQAAFARLEGKSARARARLQTKLAKIAAQEQMRQAAIHTVGSIAMAGLANTGGSSGGGGK